MDIRKIIQEEYMSVIDEQFTDDQKQIAIQNINKRVRLLKLLKSTTKQIKMPQEYIKMSEELKKADTMAFLQQFLQIKDDIPVKIEAILLNPLGVIQTIVDEVINGSLKRAKEKLQEAEIKMPKDKDYYKKRHKDKERKKGNLKTPPPKQ